MKLNVACLQLTSGSDMAANIATIEVDVKEAAARGAQLIALPENAFYMRAEGPVKSSPDLTGNAQGAAAIAGGYGGNLPPSFNVPRYTQDTHPGVSAMCAAAAKNHVWILVGSVAVEDAAACEDSRLLNRSVLINAEGRVTAIYDKLHLFDVSVGDGQVYAESKRFAPGKNAVLADTPWGYMGLSICYDVRFPQLYRAYAKAGASILTVPAAFTKVTGEAHWHALLRARAIENGCFVIAPAMCGEHAGGRKTYGHSLIVNPWGEVLVDGGDTPGGVYATLDLGEVARARAKIPSLSHDREFTLSRKPEDNSH